MKYMILLIIHGLIVLSSGTSFAEGEPPAPAPEESLNNAGKIKSIADVLKQQMGSSSSLGAVQPDFTFLDQYQTLQDECKKKESTSTTMCLEKFSPSIAKSLPLIQAAITAMGAGVKDACSSMAKAMNIANEGILAFQATCAATKALCQSSCGGAASKLKLSNEKIGKAAEAAAIESIVEDSTGTTAKNIRSKAKELDAEIERDLKKDDKLSVAGKNETCSGYTAQLASAIAGGIGILQSMNQAKKCDAATTAAAVALTGTPVDCTIPTNNLNQTCICLAAPRTAGCPGGLDTSLNSSAANTMGATALGAYNPTTATAGGAAMDASGLDGLAGKAIDPGTGLSGTGAPVGGKAAGIDGGSNGNAAGSPAAQKSASGLSTNILSGEGGGGGSGGGGYNGGSDGASGLRQFLPGGKRDPASGLAGTAVSTGVTAPGGKTNWEKVRDRYRDNNPSLLGN